jgi:VWFA-related protein
MRRLSSFLAILALLVLAAACFVWAQQPKPASPAPADQDVAIFTADTNLVVLYASVVDKNGKLLTNLPQSAFKVYENNVEQPLKTFRHEDVPVSMGIIIDNSGSMRDKRARVAAASLALVKASNPEDEEFLVDFNDEPYLDQDFTSDTKKLEQALDHLDSRGGTAMRDAISLSIDYAKEKGKREKKVLVVVTDGNDNTSNSLSAKRARVKC